MGVLEGFLYMIWRGLAIGIIISAPMGPVGILCVQRTLEKGRKTGFYTGIGAALSDLIYSLLTGFGLSFIESFLKRNSDILQLLGSVVLIGFGIYLFKSNPSIKLRKPSENIPAGRNILNGFLFTFSNPLIIFLIIGLFARFNFMMPEIKFYHYMIGFASIITGALAWWWMVTYFVDKVRSHFNLQSMWLINKIIGSAIFIFAVVGIITAVNGLSKASTIEPKKISYSDNDKYIFKGSNGNELDLRFRIRNNRNVSGKVFECIDLTGKTIKCKNPGFKITIPAAKDNFTLSVKTEDDYLSELYSPPAMKIILTKNEEKIAERHLTGGINVFGGWNAYRIRLKEGVLYFDCGNRSYVNHFQLPVKMVSDEIAVENEAGGEIDILDFGNHISDYRTCVNKEPICMDSIQLRLKNTADELEGYWGLFDYTVEKSKLRIGGDYEILILRDKESVEAEDLKRYSLIYINGAQRLPGKWHPGISKGCLEGTSFKDIYRVTWFDVEGNEIKQDIKVQFDAPYINMQIPELSSVLRFKKISKSIQLSHQ